MIPKHVTELLPRDSWRQLPGYGIIAGTWQGERWIVQRRPAEGLQRWIVGQETSALLGDVPLLIGSRSEIILEETDTFWTLQERIPGEVFPSGEKYWAASWERARRHLRDLAEALRILQGLPLPRQTEPSRTVRFWAMEQDELLREAEKVFSWAHLAERFPEEKPGELVLSHGDVSMKNMVFGDRAYLIDWEMVSALPRSADALHFAVFALKYAPPERWLEVVEECRVLADLAGLEDWRGGVLWGILRDFTAYPNGEEDRVRWRAGIENLLD